MAYPNLFSPLTVGPLELANRVVMLPVYMGYAREGRLTEAMLEHYRELGAAGAGMVVVESTVVHPSAVPSTRMLRVDDDACVPELTELAGAIKSGGTFACCQINHLGSFAVAAPQPVSASDVPCAPQAPVPKPLDEAGIAEMVDAYAQAARRVKEAGFDAVEIHGGTEYLIVQFFSPRYNRRDDEYGGSLENRMRFPLKVLRAVRTAVGPDYPVGWRFQGDEWLPDGIQITDALELARSLAAEGVAYLSVMGSSYAALAVPENFVRSVQPGYMVNLAAAVRREVDVPVIAAGRINTPALAEEILAAGRADLTGLGRGLVGDVDWVRKARTGRETDIVQCKPDCAVCMQLTAMDKPFLCVNWSKEKRRKMHELLGEEANGDA
ncbi:MAG: NADH:flavin oxidoreductase [Bacillota bacterium]